MALVRCPIHKIPFNDDNPRGCPACAREKEGGRGSDANIMAELARASQVVKRPSGTALPAAEPAAPVTQPPRVPVPRFSFAVKALELLRQKRLVAVGSALIVLLIIFLLATSGPKFTSAPSPALFSGPVRPLPVEPNQAIDLVFSALGPQPSRPHPSSGSLERYSYGTDLVIDALNGAVYAITVAVPNRAWRGLQVGMNETTAQGALALLGEPKTLDIPAESRPDTIGSYVVYRTLEVRPRRTLVAEVRPPNGCYDVSIDLQPRANGVLRQGDRSYAAVGVVGGPISWVVTRIRVVSRSLPGPYSAEVVC